MPTYQYTGDVQTVFISLPDPSGEGTWSPNPGDEITTDFEINHPMLALVTQAAAPAKIKKDSAPAGASNVESAEVAGESEEN